jgi:hypothetical protein
MISQLSIEHRSFWKRMGYQGVIGWLVSLFFFAFLSKYGTLGILFSLGILIMFLIQTTLGAKYLLVHFARISDEFEFQYYRFNELKTLRIPISELKMKWRPILQMRKGWTLEFHQKNELLFHQKNFGEWTIKMQQELFMNILTQQGRQPTMGEKLITDWVPSASNP